METTCEFELITFIYQYQQITSDIFITMISSDQPIGIRLQSIDDNNSQVIQEIQSSPSQFQQNRTKDTVEDQGLKVKVMLPKIKLCQKLNPQNPADRALAFSLRMLNQRKTSQFRMFGSNKKSTKEPQSIFLGSVSRIIDNQHFILNQSHLREGHYETIQTTPRKKLQPSLLPKLPLEQRKKLIKREVEILNKSKLLTIHYQSKKIVIDILMSVIEKGVDLYMKKSRFYYKPAPKKISAALAEFMEKNNRRNRKKSLSLSRVIDISIPNEQVEEEQGSYKSSGDDSDDEQQNESNLQKEESGSEKEQNNSQEQASVNSDSQQDQQSKQQEQQNKQEDQDQVSSQKEETST